MSEEVPKGKTPEGKTVAELGEVEERNLHSILRASIDSFIENTIGLQSGKGKEVIDAGFPELADDEWSREATRFLALLDPGALERMVFDEARRGDSTLLLAFLGASLAESEMYFGLEEYRLVEDTKPHRYIDRKFLELLGLFDKFLSVSPQFAKEYGKEEFVRWLHDKRIGLEGVERSHPLGKRGKGDLAFLKRFEEGIFGPEDDKVLQAMVQSEFTLVGGIMELDILNVLRKESNAREVLRQRLEEFLFLHRFFSSGVKDLLGNNRDKGKTAL